MSLFSNAFLNITSDKSVVYDDAIEMAIDFETGEIIVDESTNNIIVLTGKEALRVWIWKALKSEANKYRGYTYRYGQNLWKEIGTVFSRDIKVQMIYSEIEDTLMVNPLINRVYDFKVEVLDSGYQVFCTFLVDSIYGEIDYSTIANLY